MGENSCAQMTLEPLASGLSASGVWRVTCRGGSFILKIPDWQNSPALRLVSQDILEREWQVAETGVLSSLALFGIRTAAVIGHEKRQGHSWLWMEDLRNAFYPARFPEEARHVAQVTARLHTFYLAHASRLNSYSWLSRTEYRRYAHLLPDARRNLDRIAETAAPEINFTPAEVRELRGALDNLDLVDREMSALPGTLCHGDYHTRNLALTQDGTLLLVDWAHLGIAPAGCDIATFVSLYRLFGGTGGGPASNFDDGLIAAYAQAMTQVEADPEWGQAIARAVGLWHMSWGLHLRLGAGLTALLDHRILEEEERRKAAQDIRDGCFRALRFTRSFFP